MSYNVAIQLLLTIGSPESTKPFHQPQPTTTQTSFLLHSLANICVPLPESSESPLGPGLCGLFNVVLPLPIPLPALGLGADDLFTARFSN